MIEKHHGRDVYIFIFHTQNNNEEYKNMHRFYYFFIVIPICSTPFIIFQKVSI
jgi:hypothetical protein